MTVRALDRDIYEPLTNWELRTAIVVLNAMMKTGEVPLSRVTDALEQKGFPSQARAELAVEMVLLPGGPPTTKLGMIVAKEAARLSTPELFALIKRHCPHTSVEEMVAELRRQGVAQTAEAYALQAELDQRSLK
jgi:hypothetical protein